MKIYEEHMNTGERYEHKRVTQMREQDLRPQYKTQRVVPSSSNDYAYLVAKIDVLTKPFEQADIVGDTIELIICGCDDWWFNRSKGFENGDVPVQELGTCKHSTAFRTEKAKNDENQTAIDSHT